MFLNIEYEDAWTFINQLTGGCIFQKLPWASASLFNSRSARYLLYHPLVTTLPSGSSVERGKSPKTPPTNPKMIMMPSKILILINSAAAVCYSRCHWIFTYSIKKEEPLFIGPRSCLLGWLLDLRSFSSPPVQKWVRNMIFFLIRPAHAANMSWLDMLKHRQIAENIEKNCNLN